MSGLTAEDLQRELQYFAENTIRSQLSDLSKAVRDGMREELQRINGSASPTSPFEHTMPVVGNTSASDLPGQVSQMDTRSVTVLPCTIDAQHPSTTKSKAQNTSFQISQSNALKPADLSPSVEEQKAELIDGSEFPPTDSYKEAKEKLAKLRTAVASDAYMTEELKSVGYFRRCNAISDLEQTSVDVPKSAKDTMLRVTSRGEDLMELPLRSTTVGVEDIHHGMSNARLTTFIFSDNFEYGILFIICLNALFLGMSTQLAASDVDTCQSVPIRGVEYLFFFIFTVELGVRILVFRCWFFRWTTPSRGKNPLLFWNLFDTFIVVCQGFELIYSIIETCDGTSMAGNVTVLRLLRLLRIGRLLRVGKVMRMFESLRVIGMAVFSAGGIFMWAIASLLVITYIFAVYFTEVAMIHLRTEDSDEGVREHFGTLWRSWISLLKAISGGIDWGDLSNALGHVGYTFALFPFLGYVFFTLIVLMNVFTGMFLESCSEKAKEEKEIQLLRNAHNIFKLSDHNNNNTIAKHDFEASLKHRSVARFFDAIDLDIQQAEVLFELLDTSNDGLISCDEFLRGCLRLRGQAKALDLLVLSREVNQLIDGLAQSTKKNEASLMRKHKAIESHILTSRDDFRILHGLLDDILRKL